MVKCENCIHYDACYDRIEFGGTHDFKGENGDCDYYKDKSLFVELPCKVGDEVYITDFTNVIEAFVSGIDMFYNYLTKKVDTSVDLRIIGNFELHKKLEDFGKTVFLTEEQAKAKLKEMGV